MKGNATIETVSVRRKESVDNHAFEMQEVSVNINNDNHVINMTQSNTVSPFEATSNVKDNGKVPSYGNKRPARERVMSLADHSVLSAHHINYSVKIKKKLFKPAMNKQILFDVTGIFRPGMNAILGASGAGKSSFLDLLAGRVDPNNVKGTLLLDGKQTPENFKCMVGYVVQDDVVMGTLTVRENFAFSAALRLSNKLGSAEKRARVDEVIKELGLTKCADTKVGTERIRGVSGGERKRCNIGMELIIRPPVLFLDEPTSGLDANTANTVLMFLKRLSDRGRTIIFSIHQPRFSIYRLFDNMTLLASGRTVFHGPAQEALGFFENQGFVCQEHNNPPDFFLDVINGDQTAVASSKSTTSLVGEELEEETHKIAEAKQRALFEGFKNSKWNQSLHTEASEIHSKYEENKARGGEAPARVDYVTPFTTQVLVVSKRTMKNIIRNPQIGLTTFVTIIFFSLIVSAIYYDITDEFPRGFNDRKGALFFVVMSQIYLNMAAVEIFISERAIFIHENISGFYRVSVYFVVKILCDILPLRLAPVVINVCIVYFAVGFRSGAEEFFLFMLTLFAVTLAATSLCFLYSAIFQVYSISHILLSVTYVLMMLFSGFMVSLNSIGGWLRWLQYFSIVKYGIENLYIIEFDDREFCVGNSSTCHHGNDFLKEMDLIKDDFYLWENIIALFSYAVIVLALTYINLRLVKKHR